MKTLFRAFYLDYLIFCAGMLAGFGWRELGQMVWTSFKDTRDLWRRR